jgi:hypothetical protein
VHEEPLVVTIVGEVPLGQELAHDDGHKSDGILKARAVICRLGMTVDKQEAHRDDDGRYWE